MKSTIGSWFSFSVCPVTTEEIKKEKQEKVGYKKIRRKINCNYTKTLLLSGRNKYCTVLTLFLQNHYYC
jgi:hypothetical protein